MDDLMSRLTAIFQDVFDDPGLALTDTTTARDVTGWDSLSTINLVFAIEREFHIKFALGEVQEMKNVGEMMRVIRKKREKAAAAH